MSNLLRLGEGNGIYLCPRKIHLPYVQQKTMPITLALPHENRDRSHPLPKVSGTANRQELLCKACSHRALRQVENLHERRGLQQLCDDPETSKIVRSLSIVARAYLRCLGYIYV